MTERQIENRIKKLQGSEAISRGGSRCQADIRRSCSAPEEAASFALSSDKTVLFSVAIGAFMDIICETFNNQGIPALIDINGSHFEEIS